MKNVGCDDTQRTAAKIEKIFQLDNYNLSTPIQWVLCTENFHFDFLPLRLTFSYLRYLYTVARLPIPRIFRISSIV